MNQTTQAPTGGIQRFLNSVEYLGNKLPDPAMLFVAALFIVWGLSFLLSFMSFDVIDPRTQAPIVVNNLLSGDALASFLANMVDIFTGFAPLGVVLVAMLGVGVAERSGFINTGLKMLLSLTPQKFLTPMLILVAIVSHTAVDAGYVVVIPLGGIIFYAAGRHPLAGIAAAFAGVSGGFSANFVPSGLDPLLQGFTQSAAQILDPNVQVNPLANYFFTSASSLLIMGLGWYITDKIIEPRLSKTPVDKDAEAAPKMDSIPDHERKSFRIAGYSVLISLALLFIAIYPSDSPLRAPDGSLTNFGSPLMDSIVPLIFFLFLIPGIIYGWLAGTFKNSQDLVKAMTVSMEGLSYYVVMAFFCSLFINAFGQSNIGALLALSGADVLRAANFAPGITITGIILLTAVVNLVVGSASAKWALIGPIFVPMLMSLGISPDLTQAAYRVGDSSSNIITPLMPYFPLVVVYCQRYVKDTGIGTLVALMLPYALTFISVWTVFLLLYWGLGIPLGLQSSYEYLPAIPQ